MSQVESVNWRLTPSQKQLYEIIGSTLSRIRGRHRPFLLTGDVGVGKTFLSRRLGAELDSYCNIAEDAHYLRLLATRNLSELTPEATARFAKGLLDGPDKQYAILDGLEPLLSMWAIECPEVLPNFFLAMGRAILNLPTLIVVRTSTTHVPSSMFRAGDLWPSERRFHLELTSEDKETVAKNWLVDPMRARISNNLYELLATKLAR